MNVMRFILLFTLVMAPWISCAPTPDDGDYDQLTGQSFIDIGDRLNKPLLKLVGKTVRHVENKMMKVLLNKKETAMITVEELVAEMCRLHPCSDWSEWSSCDAKKYREFGGQNRSRNCGLKTTYCERYTAPYVEYDTRVCEHVCPNDYTVTKHGFCLKLYGNVKKQRDDAEIVCQSESGHLVNIDSLIKVQDVNETILEQSYSGDRLWIDGRRLERAGPWKYGYQSENASFTFWGDNDPDNGVKDLCLMYHKESYIGRHSWYWFDYDCAFKYEFICEIQS